MPNSVYWNKRFAEYGHTGYKDTFVYGWDQEVRKRIIDKYIQARTPITPEDKQRVLDFGCGVGDFSQLMLDKGCNVTAMDISEGVVKFIETRFGKDIEAIVGGGSALDLLEGGYSVIFCITVLQHMETDVEVGETLDGFYRLLVDKGILVVLELSKQENNSDGTGAYLFGRSEGSWLSTFNEHKFGVKDMITYPQTAVKLIEQIQAFRQALVGKHQEAESIENSSRQSIETQPSLAAVSKSMIKDVVRRLTHVFVIVIAFVPDKVLRINIYRERDLPYRLFILEKR